MTQVQATKHYIHVQSIYPLLCLVHLNPGLVPMRQLLSRFHRAKSTNAPSTQAPILTTVPFQINSTQKYFSNSNHHQFAPANFTISGHNKPASSNQLHKPQIQHIPAIPIPTSQAPCIAPQHAAHHEGRGSAERVAGAAHGALLRAAAPAVHLADAAAGGTQWLW